MRSTESEPVAVVDRASVSAFATFLVYPVPGSRGDMLAQ